MKFEKIILNRRIAFVAGLVLLMGIGFEVITNTEVWPIKDGTVNLNTRAFQEERVVKLKGMWEFYWDRLLVPEDFAANKDGMPQMDSLVKVPGSWSDKSAGEKVYPVHGAGTYRLVLHYPSDVSDPGLMLKTIPGAYKLYANGELITEVGFVSKDPEAFLPEFSSRTVALPPGQPVASTSPNRVSASTEAGLLTTELIIQVANHEYTRGGLRDAIKFGSLESMNNHRILLLLVQMVYIGCVGGLGIYFLIVYGFHRKPHERSHAKVILGLFCILSAIRNFFWGELPVRTFFPELSVNWIIIGNYITLYNIAPLLLIYVASSYPEDTNRKILRMLLVPMFLCNGLLLAPAEIRADFRMAVYLLILMLMLYMMVILAAAVLRKRKNAMLIMFAVGIFVFTYVTDILGYMGLSVVNISYLLLYGNIFVILAISFIQGQRESELNRQLLLYNKSLIEADRLKDEVIAAEMAFLQAQIKPHFLYNALGAIADICEKDGKKASNLIIDLSVHLRSSLEFNKTSKISSLAHELELAERYFNIEQARFGDKIEFKKEIDTELQVRIPVFVVQPLVENAVRHGISKKKGGGVVTVRTSWQDNGILLEVIDDGVGMSLEKLECFLRQEGCTGVGLSNIHRRLEGLYGSGLEMEILQGGGTRVWCLIPQGL